MSKSRTATLIGLSAPMFSPLVSASAEGVYAKFEVFLLHRDGQPHDMAACRGASYAPFDLHLFQDGSRESVMHKIL
jgi:hypothetical protein